MLTKEEKINKILRLKKEKNAIILAHYYQDGDIQDIADFVGDSLALSQRATQVDEDIILFCGVHFMAETSKILNPSKKVVIPDLNAGCSLADSAKPEEFQKWIEQYPDSVVVTYINSTAEIKAMSDLICTSSNAVKIVESIPKDKKVLFAPDKFLGAYVRLSTGRYLELWNGTCQVHEMFSEEKVIQLTNEHPDAIVLAHPECPPNILKYAHIIGSTTKIIDTAVNSKDTKFIILTEPGVIHEMKKRAPQKTYIDVPNLDGCSCNECPYMRLNTLDKIINSLETLQPEIEIPEEIRLKALIPIQRMLEISK